MQRYIQCASYLYIFYFNLLKCHMRHTALIQNANRFIVHQRKTGISPTIGLVYQQLMFRQPGYASIQTGFYSDMVSSLRCIRIGEEQKISAKHIVLCLYFYQTCHTHWLTQSTPRRNMFCPRFA